MKSIKHKNNYLNASKAFLMLLLLSATTYSFGQECAFGTTSDNSSGAENISTGGLYEYTAAADFDIPFGTIFTTNKITFNLTKGDADILFLNVVLREEQNGKPGPEIMAFDELVPTSQQFIYDIPDVDMGCYAVTVDLPTPVVFGKGKYFVQVSAGPGDEVPVGWEITLETQTYGMFDFSKFEDEDWGGTGYYSKVFQMIGTCTDSGEVYPDYGDTCNQENAFDGFQVAATFLAGASVVSVADDFTVAPNTTFYLTDFTMHSILLGGGLHNATINIRSSVDGAPGAILHTFNEKGPLEERYDGYWPFPGIPFDIVSVFIKFSWENDPIMLTEGNYFIEVIPTPYSTELLAWLSTSQPSIGDYSYTSFDHGVTWEMHEGINQVFSVDGFCQTTLGTDNPDIGSNVNFYPNPVKDVLHIASPNALSAIAVFNMEGREVDGYILNENAVDMGALANGIYIVKAQFENGIFEVFKMVKE
jgi:hypothetical protein